MGSRTKEYKKKKGSEWKGIVERRFQCSKSPLGGAAYVPSCRKLIDG